MPKVTGGSVAAHREATRLGIFESFARLVFERGYDAVTLADVAAEAHMSRTTMYNYFADKDSLAIGYAEHEFDRYIAALRAELAETRHPVDRLRAYVRRQLTYVATHHLPPGRALQFLLPRSTYQRVAHHVQVLEEILAEILRDGAAEGYFADDIESALPLVAACINRGGPTTYEDTDLGDEIDATETFVLRALGVRLAADGTPRVTKRPAPGGRPATRR